MTIAPYAPNNNEVSRNVSLKLRELRDNLAQSYGMKFGELSMGMSGDLKEAISEGSTMIRLGSALFGQRFQFNEACRDCLLLEVVDAMFIR